MYRPHANELEIATGMHSGAVACAQIPTLDLLRLLPGRGLGANLALRLIRP